jgi:sec-independent protein translocase protein TatB
LNFGDVIERPLCSTHIRNQIGCHTLGSTSLREGLGPEFADFEIEDLNPKRFVQKHLFDDLNADQGAQQPAANGTPLAPGERPPFDPNAT